MQESNFNQTKQSNKSKKTIVMKSFQNYSFRRAVIFEVESFDNIFNLIFCYFGVVDKTIGPSNYCLISEKKILSTCLDKKYC